MKLTNSTLKQYIKQVLAEQKLLTEVSTPGQDCKKDSNCVYGEKCVDGKCVPMDRKAAIKEIKYGLRICTEEKHKNDSYCTAANQRHMRLRLSKLLYPMKQAKDPIRQKKERFEINAACFGWKRKPAKEGDLGRPNRIAGKVYRDAKKSGKCPEPSKMPFAEWKMARRCNWRDNSECVRKIVARFAVDKMWTPTPEEKAKMTPSPGVADPCGKGTTPAAQLRQAAQHLHDDMQGPGSGNTVKTMIRHQKDLTALSAAFDLVTTPWEKKKWGDLAQWLSDEAGNNLVQKWGQKVRQCAPVPKWCTVCGGQTPPKGEKAASSKTTRERRPFEQKRGPVAKAMGLAVSESKTFSSFPGQQKLTEGWKKYLDTE